MFCSTLYSYVSGTVVFTPNYLHMVLIIQPTASFLQVALAIVVTLRLAANLKQQGYTYATLNPPIGHITSPIESKSGKHMMLSMTPQRKHNKNVQTNAEPSFCMQEEVTKQFYSHLPLALSQLTYTIAHNKH